MKKIIYKLLCNKNSFFYNLTLQIGQNSFNVLKDSAKKAFETNRKTINEVMYDVGYFDVKSFREVFRKITGMSPLAYKGKYYKETVLY